jgi:hypothetical protein
VNSDKTVAVLPVYYAAFDAKIAVDDSKNKTNRVFFAYLDPQNHAYYMEKAAFFAHFFKAHLAELTTIPFIKSVIRPYKSDSPRDKSRNPAGKVVKRLKG